MYEIFVSVLRRIADGRIAALGAVVERTLHHLVGGRLAGEGRLVVGVVGAGEVGGRGDHGVVELGGLNGALISILEVGGGVVAGLGRVEDVGAGDEAFGIGVGDEVGDVGVIILVKGGVIGVEGVLLGVVEGHGVGLGGRPAALERMVHA